MYMKTGHIRQAGCFMQAKVDVIAISTAFCLIIPKALGEGSPIQPKAAMTLSI